MATTFETNYFIVNNKTNRFHMSSLNDVLANLEVNMDWLADDDKENVEYLFGFNKINIEITETQKQKFVCIRCSVICYKNDHDGHEVVSNVRIPVGTFIHHFSKIHYNRWIIKGVLDLLKNIDKKKSEGDNMIIAWLNAMYDIKDVPNRLLAFKESPDMELYNFIGNSMEFVYGGRYTKEIERAYGKPGEIQYILDTIAKMALEEINGSNKANVLYDGDNLEIHYQFKGDSNRIAVGTRISHDANLLNEFAKMMDSITIISERLGIPNKAQSFGSGYYYVFKKYFEVEYYVSFIEEEK